MESIQAQRNDHLTRKAFGGYFEVMTRKQTGLNLAYLLVRSVCWLIDLIIIAVGGSLVSGLIAIPLWVLNWLPFNLGSVLKLTGVVMGSACAIPLTALLCLLPAMLEQKMAAWLLKIDFPVTPFWAAGASDQQGAGRYIFSTAAWRRVCFALLRIPLGLTCFVAVTVVLPSLLILFAMPVVYLVGFHELIFWQWRVDSFAESMLLSLLALSLAPLMLHSFNRLSRFSGWLAEELLTD